MSETIARDLPARALTLVIGALGGEGPRDPPADARVQPGQAVDRVSFVDAEFKMELVAGIQFVDEVAIEIGPALERPRPRL